MTRDEAVKQAVKLVDEHEDAVCERQRLRDAPCMHVEFSAATRRWDAARDALIAALTAAPPSEDVEDIVRAAVHLRCGNWGDGAAQTALSAAIRKAGMNGSKDVGAFLSRLRAAPPAITPAVTTAPPSDSDVALVDAFQRTIENAIIKRGSVTSTTMDAQRAVMDARAAILARMAAPQGWRDIEKDPPPKDGTPIDFWCVEHDHKIGHRTVNVFWRDGAWHQPHWGKIAGTTPTHWRYAPDAPRGKGEG